MEAYANQEIVISRIYEMIAEHTGMNVELTPETLLGDDLEIDSLERVELGIKLEKEFSIQISDSDVRQCTTLGELTQLILYTLQGNEITLTSIREY